MVNPSSPAGVNYKAARASERIEAEERAESYAGGAHTAAGRPPHLQSLFGEALRESSELAQKEFALFRTEMSQNVRMMFIGLAMVVVAAIFAIAAIMLFTESLVEWLATKVGSEALAALIVGGVMAIVAVGLVLYGRSTMSATSLAPNRSIKSIQRDKQVLSESVAS
jgi:hypothetical protein